MKNILAALLLAFMACKSDPITPDTAKLDSDFIIKKDETSRVDGLLLKFVDVKEDSRCPLNVNCIRAGNVQVNLKINDNESASFCLGDCNISNPTRYSKFVEQDAQEITTGGKKYLFTLKAVNPYPGTTPSTPYEIKMQVSRK